MVGVVSPPDTPVPDSGQKWARLTQKMGTNSKVLISDFYTFERKKLDFVNYELNLANFFPASDLRVVRPGRRQIRCLCVT